MHPPPLVRRPRHRPAHSVSRSPAIDPAAHEVTLADGSHLGYGKLLLTTGSSPRRLPVSRAPTWTGCCTCARLDDSDRIKDDVPHRLPQSWSSAAGWIGLETAAAARAAGVEVTVLESGRAAAAAGAGPPRSRRSSPTCTATTAWTCACGVQVAEITGERGDGRRGAARRRHPHRRRRRHRRRRHHPQHRAGRRPRA